jgi:hypothetical protein
VPDLAAHVGHGGAPGSQIRGPTHQPEERRAWHLRGEGLGHGEGAEVDKDDPVTPDREMLQLATDLIIRNTDTFDPETFPSRSVTALRALMAEKRKTVEVSHATDDALNPGGQRHVIDLRAVLQADPARRYLELWPGLKVSAVKAVS